MENDLATLEWLPERLQHDAGKLWGLSDKSFIHLAIYNQTVKDEKRTVAIYARLSVDRDGKKVGIDTQLEDSRRLARDRGWDVFAEYIDRNLTAADKLVARPEYDRLVQDFKSSRFSGLVCWDLDRLTRQPRQLEDWIDAAESRDVVVVTANGEADLGTDGGRLYARLKVAVAKGETERASARQKRSKQARRESGKWHGGQAPFGYRPVDGELVPAPREVALIQEAAKRLLEDRESLHGIVTDWNSSATPGDSAPRNKTRAGKHWRQSNLRSILMNRSMLGETKAGVVGWAPVIDLRTFDRLNALLTDPARKITHSPGVKGGKYSMGGGLTVCGKCSKPLITNTKTAADGSKRPVLSCLRRVHGRDDAHPRVEVATKHDGAVITVWRDTGRVSIDHTALEQYVFEKVIESLNASDRWRQRMAEGDPAIEEKIDTLEAERADLRDQRERAGKAYVLGVMSERDAQAAVSRLDTELEQRDRELNDLLGRPVITSTIDGDIDWDTWTPGRRRAFLRLLVDRVVVDEWPKDLGTFPLRRRAETDEQFEARKAARQAEGLTNRVKIAWRWDA